jgi:hypothetical protein
MIFELKEDHLTLLKFAHLRFDRSITPGAPIIDQRRPYGSMRYIKDIHHILTGEDKMEFSAAEVAYYSKLHQELATALKIILSNRSFEFGVYHQVTPQTWKKIC